MRVKALMASEATLKSNLVIVRAAIKAAKGDLDRATRAQGKARRVIPKKRRPQEEQQHARGQKRQRAVAAEAKQKNGGVAAAVLRHKDPLACERCIRILNGKVGGGGHTHGPGCVKQGCPKSSRGRWGS